MASTELSRRVEKLVGYHPLSHMSDDQRRDFHESLLDADTFEDLPGEWQAASSTQSRPAEAAARVGRLVLCHRGVTPEGRRSPLRVPSDEYWRVEPAPKSKANG